MKTYWGVEVYFHAFLTWALGGGEWSGSHAGRFTIGERTPGIHCTGGWMGSRADLDAVVKRKTYSLYRKSNPSSSSSSTHSLVAIQLRMVESMQNMNWKWCTRSGFDMV